MYKRENGRWYIDVYVKRPGQSKPERLHRSLGTTDKKAARALEAQWIAEAEGAAQGGSDQPLRLSSNLLSPLERQWPSLDALQTRDEQRARDEFGSNERTIRTNTGCMWKRLRSFYASSSQMTPASLRQYATFRQDEYGTSVATIKRDLQVVVRCNAWVREQHPDFEPIVGKLKLPEHHPGERRGRLLHLREIQLWLPALPERERRTAILLLCTGLRIEEYQQLVPADMRRAFDPGVARILDLPVTKAKWGSGRQIPLSPHLWGLLQQQWGCLHMKPNKAFNLAAAKADLEPISPQDCRHTFSSTLDEDGCDAIVEAIMGHKPAGKTRRAYKTATIERKFKVIRRAEKLFAGVSNSPRLSPHPSFRRIAEDGEFRE